MEDTRKDAVLLFNFNKKQQSHSTFAVSSLPKRLEATKERKKQAISSKQHLYGTQGGRPPSARGCTWRNWHSSPAKRIHFDSFADSSTAGPTCNDLHKTFLLTSHDHFLTGKWRSWAANLDKFSSSSHHIISLEWNTTKRKNKDLS